MDSTELENRYELFSGLVHFLDPSKDIEERPIKVDLQKYNAILDFLNQKTDFTIDELAMMFKNSPEAVSLFELILQLSNFTTAQRTYLMFNLERLNSSNTDLSVCYILEELDSDKTFRKQAIDKGVVQPGRLPDIIKYNENEKLAFLSMSKKLIADYCKKKDSKFLQERLRISEETRRRVAKYLIENRGLNNVLQGIRPRAFIENKRMPVDTKSSHGKYAINKLKEIIEGIGFLSNDDNELGSNLLLPRSGRKQQLLEVDEEYLTYCTEKEIESITHVGEPISSESVSSGARVSKRFDYVLLNNNEPKIVIEANFYTTSGSKIGINEKEYLTLHKRIMEEERGLRFIWVTDGSYWLTNTGKKSFSRLAPLFRDDLKNLAMFARDKTQIINSMM